MVRLKKDRACGEPLGRCGSCVLSLRMVAPSSVTFLSVHPLLFFFFLPWCYFSSLYTSNFKTTGKDAFMSFFFLLSV